MHQDFKIIAITSPLFLPDEGRRICKILENGEAELVHIRKPEANIKEIRNLLNQIPSSLHSKIKLHDCFSLLDEFQLGGVHLNRRNGICTKEGISLSRSMHSLSELEEADKYDYVTLSPIFDSISKEGYKSNFIFPELKEALKDKRVIALGGVTPDKIPWLKEFGFFGAAMLGYFWNSR